MYCIIDKYIASEGLGGDWWTVVKIAVQLQHHASHFSARLLLSHFIHNIQGRIAPRGVTICVRLITAIGVWADLSQVRPLKPTFIKSIAL